MTEAPVRLKVFLVEDVELIRDNLIEALQDLVRAEVVGTAATEADAVRWLGGNLRGWRLAVIDLLLEQGSGLGVLRAVAHRDADQRAVVLSNYATPDIRARCLAAGADEVYDKSTQLDEFLDYCAAL